MAPVKLELKPFVPDPAVLAAAVAASPVNTGKALDASEFVAGYRKDVGGSDGQYRGKVLLFTGKVLAAGASLGRTVVTVGTRRGGYSLSCLLLDPTQAGSIAVDAPVTVKGKVRGGAFAYDTLDDCLVVN